jgi:hypothetical protein
MMSQQKSRILMREVSLGLSPKMMTGQGRRHLLRLLHLKFHRSTTRLTRHPLKMKQPMPKMLRRVKTLPSLL